MNDFKFQIGQLVTARTAIAECMNACKCGDLQLPGCAMVTERLTQQCPGGVQRHYVVGSHGQSGRVMEIELVALADVDVSAFVDAYRNAKEEPCSTKP